VDEVFGNVFDVMWRCSHMQAAESTKNVGSDVEEGVIGEQALFPFQPHADGGRLGAFEVDASLFGVDAVEICPQRGERYENLPPSPTHVS
jgi:hypothetical protein